MGNGADQLDLWSSGAPAPAHKAASRRPVPGGKGEAPQPPPVPAPEAPPSFAGAALPCEGLPAEEQRLLDALAAIVGPEYVCTISLVDAHKIADATRRGIRDHFQRSCKAHAGDPVGADPLDSLDQGIAAALAPAPSRSTRRGGRSPSPVAASAKVHEDPSEIAGEILSLLRGAAAEVEALEGDLATHGVHPPDPEWVVFLAPLPLNLADEPLPVIHRAPSRLSAENAVGYATDVPGHRCFALPAWPSLRAGAVALEAHPRRRPVPDNMGDALSLAMTHAIARGDEEIAESMAATARLMGCTVAELEAKMAEDRGERAREERKRQVESKARRQPAPKTAPVRSKDGASLADGMRRLTERQQELLALVDVDQKTNRVVYVRDDRIPDWAALKQAVEALGGVYRMAGKKTKGGWVFPDDVDAMEMILTARETGTIFDPTLLGFYPTPDFLADELVARLALRPGDRVLEPSAGVGGLALAIQRACPGATVVCVEMVPEHQAGLRALGFEVVGGDFLKLGQGDLGAPFNAVCMNPPFGKGRVEMHHLRHALDLLGPGARLGAVMPAGLQERGDALTVALREDLARHGALVTKNARDAFRASGAMVNTVTLSLTMA